LGFNYRITKDFNDSFSSEGNSGVATFTNFPLDNSPIPVNYNVAEEQFFNTVFNGEISELNIAFSAVHLNKLYIGASFNAFDLNFSQRAFLREFNTDGNNNELEVELYQENFTKGTGFSLGAGFIYKLHPSFRVGLSYQTPTWYSEILQDKNRPEELDNLGEVTYFQGNNIYTEREFYQGIIYRLKTPSKLTASAALIFAKNGLISLDYTNKNFQNIKLSDGYFVEENQFFQNDLRNTHSFNVGTEWRIDRLSIRGGYRFEQNPYKNALDSDNLEGYSFGGGYNFGNMKIDISYSDNNRTDTYNFYPQYNNVNSSNLKIDNTTITATLTLSL
jgi:opacity protein-like surface antigen